MDQVAGRDAESGRHAHARARGGRPRQRQQHGGAGNQHEAGQHGEIGKQRGVVDHCVFPLRRGEQASARRLLQAAGQPVQQQGQALFERLVRAAAFEYIHGGAQRRRVLRQFLPGHALPAPSCAACCSSTAPTVYWLTASSACTLASGANPASRSRRSCASTAPACGPSGRVPA